MAHFFSFTIHKGELMIQPAIIVDLDGTLALLDNRGPFDWDKVSADKPYDAVVDLVRRYRSTHAILIASGRSSLCYTATEDWLADNHIPYSQLYMPRGAEDFRKDTEVKLEIYENHIRDHYQILFALDDRDQSVAFWRSLGIPTFQVAPGNF